MSTRLLKPTPSSLRHQTSPTSRRMLPPSCDLGCLRKLERDLGACTWRASIAPRSRTYRLEMPRRTFRIDTNPKHLQPLEIHFGWALLGVRAPMHLPGFTWRPHPLPASLNPIPRTSIPTHYPCQIFSIHTLTLTRPLPPPRRSTTPFWVHPLLPTIPLNDQLAVNQQIT